jgi:hypothetical protein
MVSYPLSLGLVDASIVTVAEHARSDRLASLNSRDFYVVRPNTATVSCCSPATSTDPDEPGLI